VSRHARLERIAGGFDFTEGPVWHLRGWLFFTDIPKSKIWKWELGNKISLHRSDTGEANGLALDSENRLIACEGGARRLTRQSENGEIIVLAERIKDKLINGPNDVVVGPQRDIYFSDPAFKRSELGYSGVYRVLAANGALELIDSTLPKPNGVTIFPLRDVLYVSDTDTKEIYAYSLSKDGRVGAKRTFALLHSDDEGYVDGLKTDLEGNVYCTGPGGVWLFDADGRHLGKIVMPEIATNCAWGGEHHRTLFITAGHSVYRIELSLPGVRLP
jgi:gluconolactonase